MFKIFDKWYLCLPLFENICCPSTVATQSIISPPLRLTVSALDYGSSFIHSASLSLTVSLAMTHTLSASQPSLKA